MWAKYFGRQSWIFGADSIRTQHTSNLMATISVWIPYSPRTPKHHLCCAVFIAFLSFHFFSLPIRKTIYRGRGVVVVVLWPGGHHQQKTPRHDDDDDQDQGVDRRCSSAVPTNSFFSYMFYEYITSIRELAWCCYWRMTIALCVCTHNI